MRAVTTAIAAAPMIRPVAIRREVNPPTVMPDLAL